MLNKSVYNKLKSDNFRKRFINNIFVGFSNHFQINHNFIIKAIELNSYLFNMLKMKSNAIIVGIIIYLLKIKYKIRDFTISNITNYLGIVQSSINLKVVNTTLKNKKLVIK